MGGSIGTANNKIPNFNEKNYDIWSIKMRAYLRSQDMWNLVENGYDKGDEEMRMKDGETLCIILDAIPQSLVPCLGNAETSKEAWTFLKEKYCEAKKENVPRTLSRQSSDNIEAGEEVEPSTPSPSSPVTNCRSQFEVFLSFRGPDTRKRFIGHLDEGFHQRGISSFIDSKELKKGEQIHKILEYIDKSKIFIVIFSERYAQSRWCLKELARSVESRKEIVPVFFGVEPSDVRNQGGTFKSAFQEHESNKKLDQAEVKRWRQALKKVGDLSGFNLKDVNGDEAELKRAIIHRVSRIVNKQPLLVAEPPVGIETRVQDVKKILENGSNGVHVVRIVGMGGIGKTTIAEAVYNELAEGFDGATCFLSNVRENAEQTNGLVSLQKQVFLEILKDTDTILSNAAHGARLIKTRVGPKRVLLILDDVDSVEQINALAGGRDWFGSGSVIIITTRDIEVLHAIHVKEDEIYMPKVLNQGQSYELFLRHAFNGEEPKGDYDQLTNKVVAAAGGLPLTLEVIGSLLTRKSVEEWKHTLKKLKNIPHQKVQERLKLSYNKLDAFVQKIFLDISCFFIGKERKYATYMWEACGWHPNYAIGILVQRSLIKIDEKSREFQMHDQIRDMGRAIVKEESSGKPEKQSRLWISKDSFNLLKMKGTEDVEAIQLFCDRKDKVSIEIESLAAMSQLRMLQLDSTTLKGEYERFPRNVRWLQWSLQDFSSLPTSLHLDNIVVLDLSRSLIVQVWDQEKVFLHQLKVLHLQYCESLLVCPDFTKMPNLERLSFRGCRNMSGLHPSIGLLKKLTHLNLAWCESLKKLPETIYELVLLEELDLRGCRTIEELGDSKSMEQHVLEKLEVLHLDFCFNLIMCPNFTKMPNLKSLSFIKCGKMRRLHPSIGCVKSLTSLNLEYCESLDVLPQDIWQLTSLQELNLQECCQVTTLQMMDSMSSKHPLLEKLTSLNLSNCRNLNTCPDFTSMPHLEKLKLYRCEKISELDPSIRHLKSLIELDLRDCRSLKKLPLEIGQMTSLKKLSVSNCFKISTLPPLPPSLIWLDARECSQLESIADVSNVKDLQQLVLRNCVSLVDVPGIEKLKWLKDVMLEGCRIKDIEMEEEVEPSTPSPSSPMTNCGYHFDVFLSFRGADTRKGFIGYLYYALNERGISTFIDSYKLEKGEEIHKLLEYIDKSKIFIIIFSKRYAQSRWCLKEVARSVESGKEIVPVFFGVEPSDVRNQSGTFESAFQVHESNKKLDQAEVKKWRQALKIVGDISGFNLKEVNGDEAKLQHDIIERVSSTMN